MNDNIVVHKTHIIPLKTYLAVGSALLLLTALTVYCASLPLGGWNAVIAIGIATVKGLLVALIFMHLLYDRKLFLVIVGVGIVFLGILVSLTMFDVLERGAIYENQAGPIRKEAVIYDTVRPTAGESTTIDSTAARDTSGGKEQHLPDGH
jgi:cytochrome c oxidase subunit 4